MPAVSHLQRKFAARPNLVRDAERLWSFALKRQLFNKGDRLVRDGARHANTYLIGTGWAISYRTSPNGRRQVSDFLLPGDFVCLTSAVSPIADYTVEALTPLTVTAFNATLLTDILKMPNGPSELMLWALDQEISVRTERLMSVGQRTAYERVAHILLELWMRLRQVGDCTDDSYTAPLRLYWLSDAVSLSDVHLSRTMRELRADGLFRIDFLKQRIEVLNPRAAIAACAFDPGYLKFGPPSAEVWKPLDVHNHESV